MFQAEDGIRAYKVTGVQTCALPIFSSIVHRPSSGAHFARVEPIVGASLHCARIALLGLPIAAPIVAHLAACGLGRWLWEIGRASCRGRVKQLQRTRP